MPPRRNAQTLAADLDRERLAALDAIGEAPQLRDELRSRVGLLDIALRLAGHGSSSALRRS
jgi:hypothetical protein